MVEKTDTSVTTGSTETDPSKVNVYNRKVGILSILKVDKDDEYTKIDGVEFIVYKKENNKTYYITAKDEGTYYEYNGVIEDEDKATKFVTGKNSNKKGYIDIKELPASTTTTYWIKEISAPAGCEVDSNEKSVEFSGNVTYTAKDKTYTEGDLKIIKASKDDDTVLTGARFLIAKKGTVKHDGSGWITEGEFITADAIVSGTYKAIRTDYNTLKTVSAPKDATVFTTNSSGIITVKGLNATKDGYDDEGYYDLIEITPPTNYKLASAELDELSSELDVSKCPIELYGDRKGKLCLTFASAKVINTDDVSTESLVLTQLSEEINEFIKSLSTAEKKAYIKSVYGNTSISEDYYDNYITGYLLFGDTAHYNSCTYSSDIETLTTNLQKALKNGVTLSKTVILYSGKSKTSSLTYSDLISPGKTESESDINKRVKIQQYLTDILNRENENLHDSEKFDYTTTSGKVKMRWYRMLGYSVYEIKNSSGRGDLYIYKVSEEYNDLELKGIKFIIKCIDIKSGYDQSGEGKYVVTPLEDEYSSTKEGATVYETWDNGYLNIKFLLPGTYELIEVGVGDDGLNEYIYESSAFNSTHTQVEVEEDKTKDGSASLNKVENPEYYGVFQIKKIDKETQEPLKGIGFVIWIGTSASSERGFIADSDGSISQSYAGGHIFRTDENGLTDIITNIPLNSTLYVYEVEWPEQYDVYYSSVIDGPITVQDGTQQYVMPVVNSDSENGLFTPSPISYDDQKDGKLYKNTDGSLKNTAVIEIENEQKYVNLSGKVWEDIAQGKTQTDDDRNNVYDTGDYLVSEVTVKLYGKKADDGKVELVDTCTTDKSGEYKFDKLKISWLSSYYIEFTYDGILYQNVVTKIGDIENGSKAKEKEEDRDTFNNAFKNITGEGQTIDLSGTPNNEEDDVELNYTTETNEKGRTTSARLTESWHKSVTDGVVEFDNYDPNEDEIKYAMTADTNTANLSLSGLYSTAKGLYDVRKYMGVNDIGLITEIKGINLGLYEREQADLSTSKDVYQVKLAINGYNHVYNYGQKTEDYFNKKATDFDVAVQFDKELANTYTRPIYRSDISYQTNDKSKELKVSIIYRVQIKSEATNLEAKVNRLVDYYDTSYCDSDGTVKIKAGTTVENGNITDSDKWTVETDTNQTYGDGNYYKAIITSTSGNELEVGSLNDSSNIATIYLQFDLSREQIYNILKDDDYELLDNFVEISSYTSYKDGSIYATVDTDSIPNNSEPGIMNEDDEDNAPTFKLIAEGTRTLSGTVFEDDTEDSTQIGQERNRQRRTRKRRYRQGRWS